MVPLFLLPSKVLSDSLPPSLLPLACPGLLMQPDTVLRSKDINETLLSRGSYPALPLPSVCCCLFCFYGDLEDAVYLSVSYSRRQLESQEPRLPRSL